MNPIDTERYERLIYDGARDLAAKYGQDTQGMRLALIGLAGNIDLELLREVMRAQQSPDYDLENYRGAQCDEGVIEAVKDYLRAVHGF